MSSFTHLAVTGVLPPTVHYLSAPADFQEKETCYLRARRLEGRVLSDEEVARLPSALHPLPSALNQEWHWRRRSFQRLQKFLLKKQPNNSATQQPNNSQQPNNPATQQLRILDLGCGNGWMANRLAEQPDWDIWAVDLNETELAQGARCFGRPNLRFVYADVLAGVLPQGYFDVVVLAASVQYFPDLSALWAALRNTLAVNGEIHIIDSHFYPNETARAAARQRTADYYARLGAPEMSAFYHHHLWADAVAAGAENLNRNWPTRLLQKVKWLAPFPWLRIAGRPSIFAAKKA